MTTPPRTPSTAAGRAAMRGIIGGSLALWRDEPDAIADLILAIEAEARAPLDVRNLMRDALSMLEDSEPLHASDDHRMWRIMDSLREYAAADRRGTISEHKEGQ